MNETQKTGKFDKFLHILAIIFNALSPRNVVEKSTDFVEFLVDHFNETGGHILIKASPLIAPIPSGWAVYTALSKSSPGAAIVVAFVVEGLGFAAVDAKNKIDAHNRLHPDDQHSDVKARNLVRAYFAVTMTTIFAFETIPAWALAYDGKLAFVDALLATAPLVFPVFANLGASIYSLMDVLARVQHKTEHSTASVINNLHGEIEALKTEIIRLSTVHRTALNDAAVRYQEAVQEHRETTDKLTRTTDAYNKITLENAHMSGVLETMKDGVVRTSVQPARTVQRTVQAPPVVRSQSDEKADRQNRLYRLIKDKYNGEPADKFNKTEVGNLFGTTRQTISRDLDDLVKAELITVNGVIKAH